MEKRQPKKPKILWRVTVYVQTFQGDRGYPILREAQMFDINGVWTPMVRHGGHWFTVRENFSEKYILLSEAKPCTTTEDCKPSDTGESKSR